jgi:hypothetical protein
LIILAKKRINMIKLTRLILLNKKYMNALEQRSRIITSKSHALEAIPKYRQALNFATVHGIETTYGKSGTSYGGRLRLLEAFQNASNWPVNYQAMGVIPVGYGRDYGELFLTLPYKSVMQHELVGFDEEYSETKWGILPVNDDNPYNIMRIWRKGVREFPKGADHPQGLYVAQSKIGGELAYFAISKMPRSDKLQVQSLDEPLTIALMHEVRLAAKVMTDYMFDNFNDAPEWIADVLDRYPHPSSYLNPVYNDGSSFHSRNGKS